MPYLGVPVPTVRRATRAAARLAPPASELHLAASAAHLWRSARYREQRYAATELTWLRIADGSLVLLPLYQAMIITGAWWDHVDGTAPRVGQLLIAHPVEVRPVLLDWSRTPNRWRRRASIIAQLGAKHHTDLELLEQVIDANAAHPEFSIAKAIGWALREYARTDPEWVRGFVAARITMLRPRSSREATRHLD